MESAVQKEFPDLGFELYLKGKLFFREEPEEELEKKNYSLE